MSPTNGCRDHAKRQELDFANAMNEQKNPARGAGASGISFELRRV